jgi:hypothetical protein
MRGFSGLKSKHFGGFYPENPDSDQKALKIKISHNHNL